MIIDFSVRVKNKIREKNVYIAVTRSCRFHMHDVEFAVQVY